MIEGIKIELDANELRQIVTARAAHHQKRATWYAEQIAALCAGGVSEHGSVNPVSSLRNREAEHRQRAALLRFVADHVIAGEVYRLSQQELSRFELVEHLDEE